MKEELIELIISYPLEKSNELINIIRNELTYNDLMRILGYMKNVNRMFKHEICEIDISRNGFVEIKCITGVTFLK